MKQLISALLAAVLLLCLCACGTQAPSPEAQDVTIAGLDTPAPEEPEAPAPELPEHIDLDTAALSPELGSMAALLALPDSSAERSDLLARQALLLCSGHTADNTRALLTAAGFELLTQKNFDKDDASPAHTCAFTVARKTVPYGGAPRTLLLTAIRGTNAGEWYSNFDVLPSDEQSPYAGNFLLCAEDVMTTLREYAEAETAPLFLLCGHSRGAACANLLGLLVNEEFGPANAFVYTFATPGTLRAPLPEADDRNIFNYLNPRDLVPEMPPAGWGFFRAGTDIRLPCPTDAQAPYTELLDTLLDIASTPEAYYSERHSLTGPGLSDDGLTAFEVFLLLARTLSGQAPADGGSADGLIAPESDLYPLTQLLDRAAEDDWAAGTDILHQHLPDTYMTLLRELSAQTSN